MTLGQLELFVALVEAGGFSAAGARLGIGQSSVSHTVKALEQALGTPLFDRRQSPRCSPTARAACCPTRGPCCPRPRPFARRCRPRRG
ncbi:helix-turn-helix domain-containing protein [Eleftheria terrae]|uniref:helix-turn-helix domain-containing protein n=1 Tax=Eleftheria terrae TaxID=1597781 RepID=UPI0034470E1D